MKKKPKKCDVCKKTILLHSNFKVVMTYTPTKYNQSHLNMWEQGSEDLTIFACIDCIFNLNFRDIEHHDVQKKR